MKRTIDDEPCKSCELLENGKCRANCTFDEALNWCVNKGNNGSEEKESLASDKGGSK